MAPNRDAPNVESIPTSPVATPPSTCTILDLSTEVLIEILSYLRVPDMLSAQRTCRTIRDIIVGTAYLQYILRAEINGIDDVLPPDFPYSERVELLRRHEQSWNELSLNLFTKCVAGSDGRYHDIFLQDGYLIYSTPAGMTLRYGYMDLCSATRGDKLRWVHTIMDDSIIPMSVAFAVDHDLMAAIRFGVLSNPILSEA
jgi:hypothetical protein